jgi:protein-S-isoprenylcysteine O-methyltransferase Ste14
MYLAMLFILLALGLKLGNAFNTITAALYVAYMNKYQIIPEEEVLNKIFGKAYQQYCLQVRRWF